ncbi:hypothetical protein [Prosthecobacter fusiformis]|uniref:hypothetical protein n=1 Tax=Prosthecobacter fusiformis TaxID=48464 RepID=UPI0010615C4E|nr:hypothetical protein [Prosthecobacter fusiformis]
MHLDFVHPVELPAVEVVSPMEPWAAGKRVQSYGVALPGALVAAPVQRPGAAGLEEKEEGFQEESGQGQAAARVIEPEALEYGRLP